MDPVSMIFYAIVCGLLGVLAPNLPRAPVRLAVGALVGLVAAGVLPVLRAALGV